MHRAAHAQHGVAHMSGRRVHATEVAALAEGGPSLTDGAGVAPTPDGQAIPTPCTGNARMSPANLVGQGFGSLVPARLPDHDQHIVPALRRA
eukprot:COSAG01_NODE_19_length_39011_cov_38.134968_37_plen_92_part_00